MWAFASAKKPKARTKLRLNSMFAIVVVKMVVVVVGMSVEVAWVAEELDLLVEFFEVAVRCCVNVSDSCGL